MAPFTQNVCFLEEGDVVYVEDQSYFVINSHNKKVERKISVISNSGSNVGKGNFNHYMQKEIFEQPSVIGNSLLRFIDPSKKKLTYQT